MDGALDCPIGKLVLEVIARNIRIRDTVLTVFAAVIAVCVVYNNARTALAQARNASDAWITDGLRA